jgi:hypothetical protein
MDIELFFSSSAYAARWLAGVGPGGALQQKTGMHFSLVIQIKNLI